MSCLSIILPFRDREELLADTLESIAKQELTTTDNIELILVDNGSSYATRKFVEQWFNCLATPWLKPVLISEPKQGASLARNRGVAASTAEWLYFFDSDDIMLPGHLSMICDAIHHYHENELIYWSIQYKDLSGKTSIKKPHPTTLQHNVITHGIWSTQRYVIKKRVLEKAGLWDPDLISRNDWELSIRLLLINPLTTYIPGAATALVRANNDSLTGTTLFHNRESKENAILKALHHARNTGSREATALIETYGIVFSANYVNMGNKELSKQFYQRIISESSTPKPILYLCFLWQRIIRHGASLPTLFFLKFTKNKL